MLRTRSSCSLKFRTRREPSSLGSPRKLRVLPRDLLFISSYSAASRAAKKNEEINPKKWPKGEISRFIKLLRIGQLVAKQWPILARCLPNLATHGQALARTGQRGR